MAPANRLPWLDSLKGLGILLVVFGHQYLPPGLHRWVYSFHVPLFFFVTGWLFDPARFANQTQFARRRWRTLMVPYFGFGFATWLLWVVVRRPLGAPTTAQVSALKPLFGLLWGNGYGDWLVFNPPLWFLPCLFVAANLFYWLHRRAKDQGPLALWLFVLAALGAVDAAFTPFRLPWSADVALTAAVFFGAGFGCGGAFARREDADSRLRGNDERERIEAPTPSFRAQAGIQRTLSLRRGAALLVFLAASLFFSSRNAPVDLNFNRQGNFLLFYLAAFAGIGLCVTLAHQLPRWRWLEFCGRNAIVILAFHRPAGSAVEHLIGQHVWALPFRSYTSLLSYDLFHAAAAIALCAPIALAVERWWPGVVGRGTRPV